VFCFVGAPVAEDPFIQRVMLRLAAALYRLFGREKD
jgi:hypothetical protein